MRKLVGITDSSPQCQLKSLITYLPPKSCEMLPRRLKKEIEVLDFPSIMLDTYLSAVCTKQQKKSSC